VIRETSDALSADRKAEGTHIEMDSPIGDEATEARATGQTGPRGAGE
jgi:hypothetical protein